MNATTRTISAACYAILAAGGLALLAALPAVLIVGVTDTDAMGQMVVTVVSALASVTGAVVLVCLFRIVRWGR